MSDELRECPLPACGGEAQCYPGDSDYPVVLPYVSCTKCGLLLEHDTLVEAVTAWNNRPTDPLVEVSGLLLQWWESDEESISLETVDDLFDDLRTALGVGKRGLR